MKIAADDGDVSLDNRLAYSSEGGIYTAPLRGARGMRVPNQPRQDDFVNAEPTWGPANRIVLTHGDLLYTLRVGKGKPRLVGHGAQPDWSADGKRIVFVRGWSPNTGAGTIEIARPDGSHRRKIARGESPAFSPDGKSVAYSTTRPRPGIYVVPLEGKKRRLVALRASHPKWSPDGRYVAFSRTTRCGHAVCAGRVFVIRADGGGRARGVGPTATETATVIGWIR